MPLGWIHDMPKQQLQDLACELGLSIEGKLDDLRVRVKEKRKRNKKKKRPICLLVPQISLLLRVFSQRSFRTVPIWGK
jgi:hypothetical protein